MRSQGIKANLIYQAVYRILSIITPLVTSPLLSRALGSESLGVFSATQAYANYFMLFAMLGIESYGNRSIAAATTKEKKQELFWNIYTVQLAASVIACIVYFTSLAAVSEERLLVAALQGFWIISCLLNINWFFFGCEQFRLTVTRDIIVKIVTVLCIVLFVKTPNDLPLYTFIMAGSTAITQLLMWSYLPRFISFEKPSWEKIRQHIRPIVRLFVPVIALSVFHIMDKTMLDVLSDDNNVGLYYSADKIVNIPLGLINAVSTVMLPRMTNVIHNGTATQAKQLLQKTTELILFLSSAIAFGIAAIANEFVPMFFGPGFEGCIVLIQTFVPILYIKALSELVRAQYLIPSCKDRLYINAVWAGAAANLIFNYIFILHWGALGAVLGTLVAEAVVLLIELISVRKEIPFVKYFCRSGCYILFGVGMFVGVRLFTKFTGASGLFGVLAQILFGALIFTVCCAIYWTINKSSVFTQVLKSTFAKFHKV